MRPLKLRAGRFHARLRAEPDHLPEARRANVARQIRDAHDSATAATAKKKLNQLASWLDSNGHDDAAARGALKERRWCRPAQLPEKAGRRSADAQSAMIGAAIRLRSDDDWYAKPPRSSH